MGRDDTINTPLALSEECDEIDDGLLRLCCSYVCAPPELGKCSKLLNSPFCGIEMPASGLEGNGSILLPVTGYEEDAKF